MYCNCHFSDILIHRPTAVTRLLFQLRNEKQKLNPQLWLKM